MLYAQALRKKSELKSQAQAPDSSPRLKLSPQALSLKLSLHTPRSSFQANLPNMAQASQQLKLSPHDRSLQALTDKTQGQKDLKTRSQLQDPQNKASGTSPIGLQDPGSKPPKLYKLSAQILAQATQFWPRPTRPKIPGSSSQLSSSS